MQLNNKKSPVRIKAALSTFIAVLVVMTPLCGFIFYCGCDWPWFGLDAACNFHLPGTRHRCPWCVFLPAGVSSIGLAALAGIRVSGSQLLLFVGPQSREFLLRILFGLAVFFLWMLLFGALSAAMQHYPLGIGGFWMEQR